MKDLFSPRQVAQAISVSESSLKRWCDKGLIPTVYTAGGHRRLPVNGVLDYLKSAGIQIRNPELLGLPKSTQGGGVRKLAEEKQRFMQALISADEEVCIEVLLNLYLAKYPVSEICDEVLAQAFVDIGEKWCSGEVEVYQERRSCELCQRVMYELRRMLPELPFDAPQAIGGTIAGDPYTLASTMAELVLKDLGWRATSLGNMLPFNSLKSALCDTRPKLLWLSVSIVPDVDVFLNEFAQLSEVAFQNNVSLIVGGKGLSNEIRKQMKYTGFCDNFKHLEVIANETLKG